MTMPYTQLWILVEGNDDERFIEHIKPELETQYDCVNVWKYAQVTDKKTAEFLRTISTMESAECIYLTDINSAPCITSKRDNIKSKYGDRIELDRIVVSVREIESWYLAGVDGQDCKELGIKPFNRTDDITKEKFNNMMPERFNSRIDYMREILKRFSVKAAAEKNGSFDYFLRKTGCEI